MRQTPSLSPLVPFSFLMGLVFLTLAGLPLLPPVGFHAASAPATSSTTVASSPGPTLTPRPLCGTPSWHETTISDTLVGISAVAPDDVWAAGGAAGYHWAGGGWAAHPFPTVIYGTVGIAASRGAGVWVAANGTGYISFLHAALLHWNGASWTCSGVPCPTPVVAKEPAILTTWSETIAVVGPDHVFYAWNEASSPVTAMGHLVECTQQGCIVTTSEMRPVIITGVSPSDLWIIGYTGQYIETRQILLHNGQVVDHPEAGSLTTISAIELDDVWAVGTRLWHWNGTTWSEVSAPALPSAIAGRAGNDVWAIGSLGATGDVVEHWDGTSWTVVYTPTVPLTSLSVSPAGDVWAVGGATVLHYASEQFHDVPLGSTFHDPIERLACRGVVTGYPCGGNEPCDAEQRPYFRPNAGVSRGQVLKLVLLAAGWPLLTPATPTFADVPVGSSFYTYIEAAAARGLASGYPCGTRPDELCDSDRRPYFRPAAPVSRGQLTKIITRAHPYPPPGSGVTFADVPAGSTFYLDVETVAAAGIVRGYPCGTRPDEPCDGQARPYFRPTVGAARGQVSKIVDIAFGVSR
jgi:hypothetical protein